MCCRLSGRPHHRVPGVRTRSRPPGRQGSHGAVHGGGARSEESQLEPVQLSRPIPEHRVPTATELHGEEVPDVRRRQHGKY